jgi:hypothetical protein
MDVVDKIKNVKTTSEGMHQNVPVEPVVIEAVTVVDQAEKKEKPKETPEKTTDEG